MGTKEFKKHDLTPERLNGFFCTGGTWKVSGNRLAIKETQFAIANYDAEELTQEEIEGNLMLAAASKLMYNRINQVIRILHHDISSTKTMSSSYYYNRVLYIKGLLTLALPGCLREKGLSKQDVIQEAIEILKITIDVMSDSEKEVFKINLLDKVLL